MFDGLRVGPIAVRLLPSPCIYYHRVMKYRFLFSLLFLPIAFTNAQTVSIGVRAGVNVASASQSSIDQIKSLIQTAGNTTQLEAITGFHAGVVVRVGGPNFSVQPEILYSQYGARIVSGSNLGRTAEQRTRSTGVAQIYLRQPAGAIFCQRRAVCRLRPERKIHRRCPGGYPADQLQAGRCLRRRQRPYRLRTYRRGRTYLAGRAGCSTGGGSVQLFAEEQSTTECSSAG